MRYPVNDFKTHWNVSAGYGFGKQVSANYFHEGVDINKNGGGNIELGEPIFTIAKGKLVYYHKASHPTRNFGYHSVYEIEGPWGKRWVHQAHCMEDITTGVQDLTEGQQIARVGNSGTTYAHIHFAIFKVDPATLPQGIDTIATNKQQLNAWWENPITFIETYMTNSQTVAVDSDTFERLVSNSSKYDGFKEAGYLEIEDVEDKINKLVQDNKELRQNYESKLNEKTTELEEARKAQITLNNKITDLTQAIQKDAEEDQNTLSKLLTLEELHSTLVGDYRAVQEALQLPSDASLTDTLSAIDNLRQPQDEILKDREQLLDYLFSEFIRKKAVKHKSFLIKLIERLRGYVDNMR